MSFVRTVLGDVAAAGLGVCYAHEHVIIDRCFATERNPELLLEDVELAVLELQEAHGAGVRAMIDTMPGGCGRNVEKLAEARRRSGIAIVYPTGMHLAKYYPVGEGRLTASVEELAELFAREIVEGAGVIKVAGGKDRLNEVERRAFAAAAIAQGRTGCPIITHTEAGTAGAEQVEVLKEGGADLSRVTLSHTDRVADVEYHRGLLRLGVNLEYDGGCRSMPAGAENPTVRLIARLIAEFGGQIMVGMDAARRKYWKQYGGGPGLSFLWTDFRRWLLDAGVSAEQIEGIFIRNPARAFSFAGHG